MIMAGKSEDFEKALKFALRCLGKGDFRLKAAQLDAIKYIYYGKDRIWEVRLLRDSAVCFQLQAQ